MAGGSEERQVSSNERPPVARVSQGVKEGTVGGVVLGKVLRVLDRQPVLSCLGCEGSWRADL